LFKKIYYLGVIDRSDSITDDDGESPITNYI